MISASSAPHDRMRTWKKRPLAAAFIKPDGPSSDTEERALHVALLFGSELDLAAKRHHVVVVCGRLGRGLVLVDRNTDDLAAVIVRLQTSYRGTRGAP